MVARHPSILDAQCHVRGIYVGQGALLGRGGMQALIGEDWRGEAGERGSQRGEVSETGEDSAGGG